MLVHYVCTICISLMPSLFKSLGTRLFIYVIHKAILILPLQPLTIGVDNMSVCMCMVQQSKLIVPCTHHHYGYSYTCTHRFLVILISVGLTHACLGY